jgi:NADH:ubiquinone oxidoreductase subunit 5 (subunit L)/multisubunit Na+/H+ antiporter MnhA subunit
MDEWCRAQLATSTGQLVVCLVHSSISTDMYPFTLLFIYQTATTSTDSSSNSHALGQGAVAAIVVAILAVAACIIGYGYYKYRLHREAYHNRMHADSTTSMNAQLVGTHK